MDTSVVNEHALPSLALLNAAEDAPGNVESEVVGHNQEVIQRVMDEAGVKGKVAGAVVGPRITRYEITPGPGASPASFLVREDAFAMALKVKAIRVLAPIPGRDVIGIEVPNPVHATAVWAMSLRGMLESETWRNSQAAIPVAIGRDVAGNPIIFDLAEARHLLIAGATGSGKSVCIHALLMSLLFRFGPETLRLILIDPIVINFEVYKNLPHLLTEVVSDPEKALRALRWSVGEMEHRYRVLAKVGVRNLSTFNARAIPKEPVLDDDGEPIPPHLPFIIIVIDELADIVMLAKGEVEIAIARLAQKARAVGIHMVLATQTPRKDIVTGIIKANLQTRIAFQVRSVGDSRAILEQKGAETLLGRGDMLMLPPDSTNLERLQVPMVFDEEITAVAGFVSAQGKPQFIEAVVADAG